MANVDALIEAQANVTGSATGWATRVNAVADSLKTDPAGASAQADEIVASFTVGGGGLPAANARPPGWKVTAMVGSGNAFSVATFIRSNEAAPRWICVGGSTNDLFSQNVNIVANDRMVQTAFTIPTSPVYYPYLLMRLSIRDQRGSGNVVRAEGNWRKLATGQLLDLLALANNQQKQGARVLQFYIGVTQARDIVAFGRTSANRLLVTSSDAVEDPWPLSVRGGS